MMYIIKDEVEASLPEDWTDRANAAREYVCSKVADAQQRAVDEGMKEEDKNQLIKTTRSSAISARADRTWRYLAPTLAEQIKKKCWYCESLQSRSDKAVDHFRPKSKVEEDPTHPGYWWLAFDWENYRYCCTFCNSFREKVTSTPGGKQCHFSSEDIRQGKS